MDWTEDKIRFFLDAMPFTDYYDIIAKHIAKYLPENPRVCDAGCGVGGLSTALLPYCSHITAVDHSKVAIEAFGKLVDFQSDKISIYCSEMLKCTPARLYDAMVFCLFGDIDSILQIAALQCSGEIIMIKRDFSSHRFSAGNVSLGKYTAEHSENVLSNYGITFTSECFTASFGQPFRSLDDARRFFKIYNRSRDEYFTDDEIAKKLVKGPNAEFPLYLPNEKRLRLIRFSTNDIKPDKQRKNI